MVVVYLVPRGPQGVEYLVPRGEGEVVHAVVEDLWGTGARFS